MVTREVLGEVWVECTADMEDMVVETGEGGDTTVVVMSVAPRSTGPETVIRRKMTRTYDYMVFLRIMTAQGS